MQIKLEYILIVIIILIALHLLMDNCNCERFSVGGIGNIIVPNDTELPCYRFLETYKEEEIADYLLNIGIVYYKSLLYQRL